MSSNMCFVVIQRHEPEVFDDSILGSMAQTHRQHMAGVSGALWPSPR
jgi:hypothetical protein